MTNGCSLANTHAPCNTYLVSTNAFGTLIKQARQNAELTQVEFASAIGLTQQTVSRWESGHVLPRNRDLPSIAQVLKIPLEMLERANTESDVAGRNGSSRLSSMEQELAQTKMLLAEVQAKLEQMVRPPAKRVAGKKLAPGRQARKRA